MVGTGRCRSFYLCGVKLDKKNCCMNKTSLHPDVFWLLMTPAVRSLQDYSLRRLTVLLAKSCCVANRLPDSVTTPLTRFISSRAVNSCSSGSINLHLQAHFLTRNTVLQPSAAINFSTSANQRLFSNKNPPNGAFSKAKWAAGAVMRVLQRS